MSRLVLKFGGTSVGTITKIKNVANIVKKKHQEGNEIIVVVSAMSGVTNDLMKKSHEVSENFNIKELDVLLSSGEQASSALLAGAIIVLGANSRSWMGWQIPLKTDNKFSSSLNGSFSPTNVKISTKKGIVCADRDHTGNAKQ